VSSCNFERCKTCGQYERLSEHTCPPRWRVDVNNHHDPDDARDGLSVHAVDAETAAIDAVEKWDERERDVLNGSVTVQVRPWDRLDAKPEVFEVTAEAVVEYTAYAKEVSDG
jgi:hypothetical protein